MATITRMPFFGYDLTCEVETQWAELSPVATEPDPDWRAVDINGHGHFAQQVGKRVEHPTIEWVSEPCTMGHGEDCDAEGEWRCKVCGVEVQPGTRAARPVKIATRRSLTLVAESDGERVVYRFGDEQWQALTSAIDDVVRSTLDGYDTERTLSPR